MKTIALVVLTAVVAVGCAHGAKAQNQEPERKPDPQVLAKLKAIAPHSAETGVVVLYRNTAFGGLFGPMAFNGSLFVDEQAVGDVSDDKYNVVELPAGRHSFWVRGTAPGIVVPLQATTVLNLAAGETKFLEVHTVQEFNAATIKFQPGQPLETIAVACTEGFIVDLGPDKAPSRNVSKQ